MEEIKRREYSGRAGCYQSIPAKTDEPIDSAAAMRHKPHFLQ
jgi:hypothetical protein